MRLELELAVRFLRRRTALLLRGTALAALSGVALATTALVITLALMNGYESAIANALQRANAHLVGFAPRPMRLEDARAAAARLERLDGVRRVTPVTYLMGLVEDPRSPANPMPITLKAVAAPPTYTGLEVWPSTDGIPAVPGAALAHDLGVHTGSWLTVRLPPQGNSWILPGLRLEMVGTFRLDYSEFDEGWIIVPLERVAAAVPGTGVAGLEVMLTDPLAVARMRQRLEEAEPSLLFTDWREMNRAQFAALRWQTLSLFVVLSLVVAVASFQVSSALVVLAIDKRRAAGMLQALGATPAMVRRVLVWSGLLLGGAGVALGVVIGWLASLVLTLTRAIRFPPGLAQVYGVDHIPLEPRPVHILAVVGVCLVLVFIASLWPAFKTSREDPVASLRAV